MLESREGAVNTGTAIALAAVFGVSVEYLANGDGEGPTEEAVKAAVQRARERATPAPAEAS